MKLKSIAIIACWYGKYPWYFSYFIHSCKFNPTIDFYLVTDNSEIIPNKPDNVIIINKSMEEFKKNASDKLRFDVKFDDAYKICDFKPAYGFLFPEIIEKYDFWGQCDLDVIFGNVRNFFTAEMLSQYDFISLRHDYATGCFMLFRNNELMKTFFMKSKDYKRVFSESRHYCFDECNFAWNELANGKSIFEIETEVESFTYVVRKAEREKQIRAHFDFILIEGLTGRVTFDNGRIYYKNEFEGIMYHIIQLKKVYNPPRKIKIPNKYYISKTRIYTSKKNNSIEISTIR